MAKTRASYGGGLTKRTKRVPVMVQLQRLTSGKFDACASFGRGGDMHRTRKSQDSREACALAKNPRKAIAAALKRLGGNVGKRSGAFAGLKKGGR